MRTHYLSSEPQLLRNALAFTAAHEKTADWPKHLREVHLLGLLYPDLYLGPEATDLFAGRTVRAIAGVTNQTYGERQTGDQVGYFYDRYRAERIVEETGGDTELRAQVEAMTDYWESRTCNARITAAMDGPMHMVLPSSRYPDDSSACHRLYRIASPSVDFAPLLELGVGGFKRELAVQLESETPDSEEADFLQAGISFLDLIRQHLQAFQEEFAQLSARCSNLTRRRELNRTATALESLQQHAPQNLFEALQLVHLYLVTGYNCNAFGRMDDIFGPFLVSDLERGELSEDEAVRLLLSLWNLWGEHFLNSRITLGGEGRKHPEAADVFCRVALEATRIFYTVAGKREIRRPPFQFNLCPQVAFRFSRNTAPELYAQALDVNAAGTTFPMLYNDDANIPAVARAFRIGEKEAAQYTFFDCGEYIIDNRSIGTPSAIINLPKCLELALHDGIDPNTGERRGPAQPNGTRFESFEDVWEAYTWQTEFATHQCARYQKLVFDVVNEQVGLVALSLMMPDCRKHRRGLLEGGCERLGGTFETYGNITAADSLYALREVVFRSRQLPLYELVEHLDKDFADAPELREQLLQLPKFGNDEDDVDAMAQRVNDHLCQFTRAQASLVGLDHYLVVVINNGANVLVGRHVRGTADGRCAGEPVSNGHTATAGRDTQGLPALLNSIVKLSANYHAGAVHNVRFSNRTLKMQRPLVEAMLATYWDQGGTQAMLTVTSREELLDALENPEAYGHLLVRVGGYSARFIDLPPDVQEELVNRNAY